MPSPARSDGSSVATRMLTPSPPQQRGAGDTAAVASGFHVGTCYFCEPEFGETSEVCEARRVLEQLAQQISDKDEEVIQQEEVRALQRTSCLLHTPDTAVLLCPGRCQERAPCCPLLLVPQVGVGGAWAPRQGQSRPDPAVCR